MHKYGPDGTVGASWHPWIMDGEPEIPFQEDGTALVVWALRHHYQQYGDKDFWRRCTAASPGPPPNSWRPSGTPRRIFPCPRGTSGRSGAGHTSGRPPPSRPPSPPLPRSPACSATPSLRTRSIKRLGSRTALLDHFWDDAAGRFARMVTTGADGELVRDMTVDSSVYALFAFGVLAPDDPKMVATMHALGRQLWVKAGAGGLARYERDYYFRVSEDFDTVPGNPWIICTLWLAEWYIATANEEAQIAPRARPAGMGLPLRPEYRRSIGAGPPPHLAAALRRARSPGPTPSSSRQRPTIWTSWPNSRERSRGDLAGRPTILRSRAPKLPIRPPKPPCRRRARA